MPKAGSENDGFAAIVGLALWLAFAFLFFWMKGDI